MPVASAHFVAESDGSFSPTDMARSRWGPDTLNGPALVGLAAWELESRYRAEGFAPVRFTADLFKAARRQPTLLRSRIARAGGRIRVAECDILQDGAVVVRAVMAAYRRSRPPPGAEWVPRAGFSPPPGAEGPVYLVGSDDAGWAGSGADHQNTSRKRVYHRTVDAVAGHPASPFVRTVVAAEATSLVTNLGSRGIGYINGDLTVALCRLPLGDHIGVQADSHWCADGVSVGTATLFDDAGPFGTGMVTALANPAAQIDFADPDVMPILRVP
ncbi:MAG: acyl-CoA thioesterase domain-containing protein [Mycobacterium sp.]